MIIYQPKYINHLTKLLFLFYLSIKLVHTQYQTPNITYANCSSPYCLQCINQYQCSLCLYNTQPICCPKYCIQCHDMNTCIECQPFFVLKQIESNIICTRISNNTDPNMNQSSCNNGQYFQPVTSSCYNCNFPNCQTCESYQSCQQCLPRHYLWNASQIGINPDNQSQTILISVVSMCQQCISNYNNCSNAFTCNQCDQSYFFNNSACVKCAVQYCLNCNGAFNCTMCAGGSYLNGSSCYLCSAKESDCTNCTISNQNNSNIICSGCSWGLYWNGSKCLGCQNNCRNCSFLSGQVTCYQCQNKYALNFNTSQCVSCLSGCNQCQTYSYNGQNKIDCNNCSAGYTIIYLNQTQVHDCIKCTFPCIQCYNDSNICGECEMGFYINYEVTDETGINLEIGKCYFCSIQNCISCNSKNACTVCENGYYIKYSFQQNLYICIACPLTCSQCMNKNINSSQPQIQCTRCNLGFTLINTTSNCIPCDSNNCISCDSIDTTLCYQCLPGFMTPGNSNLTCQTCNLSNCRQCYQYSLGTFDASGNSMFNNTCQQCYSSYCLVQSKTGNYSYCQPCQQNCAICLNNTFCIQCQQSFQLYQGQNKQINCITCPEQCLTCNQYGCIFCNDLYYPVPIGNFYQNSTISHIQCSPCNIILGCISCYNQQFCKQCTSNKFSVLPGIDGSCLSCPQGCLTCDNDQICNLCGQGYLINNQTNECLNESGWPAWGIFMICTFGIAFLFVAIQKSYRRVIRRCKRQEDKQQNSNEFRQQKCLQQTFIEQINKQIQQPDVNKNRRYYFEIQNNIK